jgi:hypothetical protein
MTLITLVFLALNAVAPSAQPGDLCEQVLAPSGLPYLDLDGDAVAFAEKCQRERATRVNLPAGAVLRSGLVVAVGFGEPGAGDLRVSLYAPLGGIYLDEGEMMTDLVLEPHEVQLDIEALALIYDALPHEPASTAGQVDPYDPVPARQHTQLEQVMGW